MAWTAPRTWVAGEVVTAAVGNTHWRDNLLALNTGVAHVYMSANVNHTTSGSFQTLSFDSEIVDIGPLHDTSVNPTRLTAVLGGYYFAFGYVAFAATAQTIGARIGKNGGTQWDTRIAGANSGGNGAFVYATVSLAAGDYLELAGLQNSGGTLSILGGSGGASSYFGASLVYRT